MCMIPHFNFSLFQLDVIRVVLHIMCILAFLHIKLILIIKHWYKQQYYYS